MRTTTLLLLGLFAVACQPPRPVPPDDLYVVDIWNDGMEPLAVYDDRGRRLSTVMTGEKRCLLLRDPFRDQYLVARFNQYDKIASPTFMPATYKWWRWILGMNLIQSALALEPTPFPCTP